MARRLSHTRLRTIAIASALVTCGCTWAAQPPTVFHAGQAPAQAGMSPPVRVSDDLLVPRKAVLSLCLGSLELPANTVHKFTRSSIGEWNGNAAPEFTPPGALQIWDTFSVPLPRVRSAVQRMQISIDLTVLDSRKDAASKLDAQVTQLVRDRYDDVSRQAAAMGLADRALVYWGTGTGRTTPADLALTSVKVGGAVAVFTRANVFVRVHLGNPGYYYPAGRLIDVWRNVTRRIDAARSDLPIAPPTLPIGIEALGMANPHIEKVTEQHEVNGLEAFRIGICLGKPLTTIGLQHGTWPARSTPACQVATGEYFVPLTALMTILSKPGDELTISGGHAAAAWFGRVVKLTENSTSAGIDGREVDLSRPARIEGAQVFVPLSLIEQVTGLKIHWCTENGIRIARVGSIIEPQS